MTFFPYNKSQKCQNQKEQTREFCRVLKGEGAVKLKNSDTLFFTCSVRTPQHLPCPGKCRVPGGYSLAVVFPLRSSDLFQFYTLLPKTLTTSTTGKQLYKKNVLGKLYFPQKNLQEKWISTRLFLPCFPSSTTNVNFVQ